MMDAMEEMNLPLMNICLETKSLMKLVHYTKLKVMIMDYLVLLLLNVETVVGK